MPGGVSPYATSELKASTLLIPFSRAASKTARGARDVRLHRGERHLEPYIGVRLRRRVDDSFDLVLLDDLQ